MNIKLHHFRDYVDQDEVKIHKVSKQNQRADYLAKPQDEVTQKKHRKKIKGW